MGAKAAMQRLQAGDRLEHERVGVVVGSLAGLDHVEVESEGEGVVAPGGGEGSDHDVVGEVVGAGNVGEEEGGVGEVLELNELGEEMVGVIEGGDAELGVDLLEGGDGLALF